MEVISALLEAYPDAAKRVGGELALHLAIKNNASVETINCLLDVCPEVIGGGVRMREIVLEAAKRNQLPLHYAFRSSASVEIIN